MSDYTPGPWLIEYETESGEAIIGSKTPRRDQRYGGYGCWQAFARAVVRMEEDDKDNPEGWANARLIAAAPDMLALLKRMEDWLRPEVTNEPDRTFFWEIVELRRKIEGKPQLFDEQQSSRLREGSDQ